MSERDLDEPTGKMNPSEIRRELELPAAGRPGQHRAVDDPPRVSVQLALIPLVAAVMVLILLVVVTIVDSWGEVYW